MTGVQTCALPILCESIWDEHAAIVDAILLGNADLAEALIRQHGEDAAQNLAELLAQALTLQTGGP